MTEFQITAAFILIPLFLIIPLLAKYIDIKHATINAARYQAWEYTAWHNKSDDHKILDNYTANSVPYKSPGVTATESRQRIFSKIDEGNDALVIDNSNRSGWRVADRNPLWTDHSGNNLYAGTTTTTLSTGNDTPGFKVFGFDTGKVLNVILKVFNFVFKAFGALLSIIPGNSGAEFSAINTEGYTEASLSVPVQTFPGVINVAQGSNTVNFQAQAAVLSETWNAGGTSHAYKQVGGAVPTTLLKELQSMPVMGPLWDVISFMAPELTRCKPAFSAAAALGLIPKDGSLWFGYVDGDTVHPDRLSGGGSHVCDAAGRCRLEPVIPTSHSECIP